LNHGDRWRAGGVSSVALTLRTKRKIKSVLLLCLLCYTHELASVRTTISIVINILRLSRIQRQIPFQSDAKTASELKAFPLVSNMVLYAQLLPRAALSSHAGSCRQFTVSCLVYTIAGGGFLWERENAARCGTGSYPVENSTPARGRDVFEPSRLARRGERDRGCVGRECVGWVRARGWPVRFCGVHGAVSRRM
jgi:hypothetical protein